MPNAPLNHWIVGSAFDRRDDQTSRFLAEGIWEIANPSGADQALVKAMLCPVDGTSLKMTERSAVGLDHYPKCWRVWLDWGELGCKEKVISLGKGFI